MLTGSNTLSLPSPLAVFAQLFSIRFLHYVGFWNRLGSTKIHSPGTVSEYVLPGSSLEAMASCLAFT